MKLNLLFRSLAALAILLIAHVADAAAVPEEAAGNYTFFAEENQAFDGRGAITITKRGAFTGFIRLEFLQAAFAGRFDENGKAEVLLRKDTTYKGSSDYLELSFSPGGQGEPRFEGTVRHYDFWTDDPVAFFIAEKNVPAGPLAGRYSAVLTPLLDETSYFYGNPPTESSNAKFTVRADGSVFIAGRTALGRAYSSGAHLRAGGSFRFFNAKHVFVVQSGKNYNRPLLDYDDVLEGTVTLAADAGTGRINWSYYKKNLQKEVEFSCGLSLQATRVSED